MAQRMSGYVFEHEGQQYAPAGKVAVPDVGAHNRALTQAELDLWATGPDRWAAYHDDRTRVVTTWLGSVLGTVVHQRTYRDGFGHRMTAIRVRGTNGREYYGRYGSDWSQLVRLRAVKGGR